MDSFIVADRWFLSHGTDEIECIERCKHDSVARPTTLEAGKGVWVVLGYVSCGDYNRNGSVGRSNVRVFEEEHAALFTSDPVDACIVRGSHGYRAVAVRWEAYDHKARRGAALEDDTLTAEEEARLERWDALASTLAHLEDHIVLDENDHTDLEAEEETEAWESYGRRDFRRELFQAHPDADDAIDSATDAQIDALWYELCESEGEYPEHDGEGVNFPTYDLARAADVIERLGAFDLEGNYI